jgi:hypothetical protein
MKTPRSLTQTIGRSRTTSSIWLIAGLPEDGSTIVPSAEIPLLIAGLVEGVQADGETSKITGMAVRIGCWVGCMYLSGDLS